MGSRSSEVEVPKPKGTDDQTTDSSSTASSVTQVSRPPTPLESLRQQLDKRIASLDAASQAASDTSKDSASTVNSDETIIASTVSDKSKASGRMSTSSAKNRQLDEVLQPHKQDSTQAQAQQSERVAHMERQLQRVHEFDSKLDTIQTDFATRLNLLEGRMEASMDNNMAKLLALVQAMHSGHNPSTPSRRTSTDSNTHLSPAADLAALQKINTLDSDGSSTLASSSSKASGMSVESTDPMQSPEHKKHKSGGKGSKKKRVLYDSIRRRLDELNETKNATETESQASDDSLDKITDEMEEIMESKVSLDHIPPTSERQYTDSPGQEVDTQASSSDGRGSQS
jgi:chromosome segregation ATPase